MYAPSKEQAEEDRAAAYEAGVPHGALAQQPRAWGGGGGSKLHSAAAHVGVNQRAQLLCAAG